MRIENRLRDVRKKKRISQDELARMSGVSRTTISNIEKGVEEQVKTDTLFKLSAALGKKVRNIFFL